MDVLYATEQSVRLQRTMRYCIYYWLIEPLRGGIADHDDKAPSIDHDIVWKDKKYKFKLFSDRETIPYFARLEIPCSIGEIIPNEALPLITIVKEHLLSTLRLTWRDDARLFPMNTWRFWEDSEPKSFNFKIEMGGGENPEFDERTASAIFEYAIPIREEFRLYVDGIDTHIPPQYRFLAFYKLLERHFKYDGSWQSQELSETLNSFAGYYKGSVPSKDFTNELHELRDKCAHIYTGKGKREVLGVTQLNHSESVRVHSMLPMLAEICRGIINKYSEGKFVLGEWRPWYDRLMPMVEL